MSKKIIKPTPDVIDNVLDNIASPNEARDVAKWIATNEGLQYLSESIDSDANSIKLGDEELYVDHEIPTDKMLTQINGQIRRKRINKWLFRVAAVLIPAMVALGLYLTPKASDIVYEEVYVAMGETLEVELNDGTKVFLNSDSHLKYPKEFITKTREVFLTGEGYFDVESDQNHPFIVRLGDTYVRVTGTEFNIEAYEGEDLKVALKEGAISFNMPTGESYDLSQGEILDYNVRNGEYVVSKDVDGIGDAWRENRLVFNDAPMSYVVSTLERRFDVKIKVMSPKAMDCRYTFAVDDPKLESVLFDMSMVSPINIVSDTTRNEVVIRAKE